MTHRYSISTDGGTTWTDVSPVNGASLSLSDERDLGKGQIFFRRFLKGSPRLRGNDYLLLYPFERAPHRRCEELLLRLEAKCGAGYREVWRGRFSAGTCAWDLDRCEVELKVETVDRYTCLLDGMRVKRNILSVLPVDVRVPFVMADLEVYACATCEGFLQCQPSGNPLDPNWAWNQLGTASFNVGTAPEECTCIVRIWGRVKVSTTCVGGNPVTPPGSGWELLENNCATDGTATYVRELTGDEIFLLTPSLEEGECIDGVLQPPDCAAYIKLFDCDAVTTDGLCIGEPIPYHWLCIGNAGAAYDRSRLLEDVADHLLTETGCEAVSSVASDFFEWLPPGDAPGYVPGYNYVTGQLSQVNQLVILQKSDAIDPTASNPATIGEMTLEELLEALRVMFQVYWDIDDAGRLRIEHWSYWTAQAGMDLTAEDDVVERLRYEHLSEAIPRIERVKWMEAQGTDFVGRDIVYSGPCVRVIDGEGVEEYSPGRITTDINYVNNEPTAIAKDGFVILATNYDGSVYTCILAQGAITGNFTTNGPLSWANLQRDFWRHNRFLPSGEMNGQFTVFEGYLPNIEQKDVSAPVCCSLYNFNARDYLTTNLGARIGVAQAMVESVEHDLTTGRATFVLRYAY